ncbi:MAG: LrgB family protein [Spirochaetaceae bacterium]|jgi:putative effector of murein hydrolase|nr:LrgB family protein [Spirochaetaceae bacterium]
MAETLTVLKDVFIASPYFGLCLSLLTFEAGRGITKKLKTSLLTPLVIAATLSCLFMVIFDIPLEAYNRGGAVLSLCIPPVTCTLAVSLYNQMEVLKKNILPVLAGTTAGALVSVISITVMCKAAGLDRVLMVSLMPKSVTNAIALELSRSYGGIPAITILGVMIAGNMGAMLAPHLIKLFRVKNRVAAGIGIGTASHALGTAKALEIGEVEGAASSLAIGCTGLATTIIAAILLR